MSGQKTMRLMMLMLLAMALGVVPSLAGSAAVGMVAGSKNATVGGQELLPNTTLFSGDHLQVKDGVAVVAMGQGSRMVFGKETVASFEQGSNGVTVALGQGNISLYHPKDGQGIRVKVGEISVVPGSGFATLGEVALLNGSLQVTAKEGALRIEGKGPAVEVAKGKTVTVPVAAAPQGGAPPAAGAPASHITQGAVIGIAGAGAAGVGAAFAIMARSKADDAVTAATAACNAAKAISPSSTTTCP